MAPSQDGLGCNRQLTFTSHVGYYGLVSPHYLIYEQVVLAITLYRSKTGFRRTDTVLNHLIMGAIQTGLFATIFSLGDLISFLRDPLTNLYGMFAFPIGRIYTNVG